MPPGATRKASDISTNWCRRVKNVRCSKAMPTNVLTSCSNGRSTRIPTERTCSGELAAPGDDVAAQFRQRRRHALGLLVTERSLPRPCRAEDADAIALAPGWLKAGEIVDQIPEPEDGLPDDLLDRVLVTQADRIGPRSGRIRGAHQATR